MNTTQQLPSFHLLENFTAETITFSFEFSNEGSYDAWAVECNGIERSHGRSSGQFGGVISPGSILLVRFKVWNGSYKISYTCKVGTTTKSDSDNKSPIEGSAIAPRAAIEEVKIQF